MRLPRLRAWPASWLRLPRRTARLRLTVLYGVLFFLLGVVMLVFINVLVRNAASGNAFGQAVSRDLLGGPSASPKPATLLHGHASDVKPGKPPASIQSEINQLQAIENRALQTRASDLRDLVTQSETAVAVMTGVSLVLGWFTAGRVLRPVRTITRTAQVISASNLNERLAFDGPNDEFKQLADTLDNLIARLEASFEGQRHFVANASHELRTPLTLERALLQVVLADPDAPAATLRSACHELLEANAQQERLIESLLTLASSERGLEHRESFDLATVAQEALRTPRREIEDRQLGIQASICPAPATGDPHLAGRLIANLIDNAVRYNVRGGRVEVSTEARDGHSVVSVTNTGPLIQSEQVGQLFQPFQRLEMGRANYDEGHGLGLSIVRAIARAHDASLTARACDNGGLHIEVAFPRQAGWMTGRTGSRSVQPQSGRPMAGPG